MMPLNSINFTAGVEFFLPIGARLVSVRAEADNKTTCDYVILHRVWDPTGAAVLSISVKYAGMRNGQNVNFWKEWPILTTKATAPTATGHTTISIVSGSGVIGIAYYVVGGAPQG